MRQKDSVMMSVLAITLWILFLLLLISLASAMPEGEICNTVFFFIISNLDSESSLVYSDLDLTILSEEIGLNETEALNYISNYEDICSELIGLNLPVSNYISVSDFSKFQVSECEIDINKEIIWGAYDLDMAIPFFDVYIGEESCEEINLKKIFFKIEYDYPNIYKVTGIKLYLFLLASFLGMAVWMVKIVKSEKIFKS